jgi:hypothetical protein
MFVLVAVSKVLRFEQPQSIEIKGHTINSKIHAVCEYGGGVDLYDQEVEVAWWCPTNTHHNNT